MATWVKHPVTGARTDIHLTERAFADAVQKSRPAGAKGHFINRVAISSTMGPGIKVEPTSLFASAQPQH